MKIVVGKEPLAEVLQSVGSVIPQKPTVPVLSNYLLQASNGKLTVSGTDMDMYIVSSIDCTVVEEGSVTVNARRFIGVIRELPSEDISISAVDEKVVVSFRKGESSILGMPASDFPALKDTLPGEKTTISGSDFMEMVGKTSFSVATERTRIALTGVYWDVSPESMVMAATDGHRLALFEKTASGTDGGGWPGKKVEVIIPPKALTQVTRVASGSAEPSHLFFDVIFGEGAILFDFGGTRIFSKLIDGPYPDFRRVLPVSSSKHVYVNTEDLASSVKRVSVLSSSITHQIRISISSGSMEISTTNVDIGGESHETIPVRYEGESIMVGYNATFLAEILKAVDTDEVILELESPISACVMKPAVQKENEEYRYLIMPLRLNE